MTTPENDNFHINLTASEPRTNTKSYAAVGAAVTILFIILTMTTDLASWILPMKDDYLQAMIPLASDGAEALSLTALTHEIVDKTITVKGSVMNRTDYPITGLTAVVSLLDTTGRFGQTVDITPDPPEIPAHGNSAFTTTVTLQEKPAGYSVKFHFVDGPFVPHKDERTYNFDFPGN